MNRSIVLPLLCALLVSAISMWPVSGCRHLRTLASDPVTLEFRTGSMQAAPGLHPHTLPGTDSVVYLSDVVVLSNQDIQRAELEPGHGTPHIRLQFSKLGKRKLEMVTSQNIGEPLGILADGKLLCAPEVREKIAGGEVVITGSFTEDAARAIVNGVMRRR